MNSIRARGLVAYSTVDSYTLNISASMTIAKDAYHKTFHHGIIDA